MLHVDDPWMRQKAHNKIGFFSCNKKLVRHCKKRENIVYEHVHVNSMMPVTQQLKLDSKQVAKNSLLYSQHLSSHPSSQSSQNWALL